MTDRDSNFDLLKILLILMVIVLHYFNGNMGGLLLNVTKGSFNYYLSHLLESFCIIAVNVFIIITGYFSCEKKSINISKVIKLYSIAIFYGIMIFLILLLFKKTIINFNLVKQFFNATFSRWFVLTYCILYLLIPFINKLILSINKKELKTLIGINIIVFYMWSTFFTNTTIVDSGYGITNFIILYMMGAYIKLYINDDSKTYYIYLYIICTLITTIYSFIYGRAWSYSTIFNLISSISLFMIFKNIKIKNNKIINSLATYTFTVYIIHENNFVVKFIYNNIFKSNLFWNSNYMIIHLIITTIGIYLMCVIIEYLRRKIFSKYFDNKIDNIKYKITCS